MNDNFNNDKWVETAAWIKKEPLSSHAVLGEVAPIKSGQISNLGLVFHCGNCNSTNIKLVVNDKGDYKHFKYCPDCGTKVDWRNFA